MLLFQLPEVSVDLVQHTISHYHVLRKLGGGGMGVVYEAEDLRLRRHVALKFLPESLTHDGKPPHRLEREARTASSLNHPNICTVYESDAADGQSFIAMEFLDGKTLKHTIQGKPMAIETLLDVALQIASALDAAHSSGIVHRDIKPANIFVTKQCQAKVLDFGLATSSAASQTGSEDTETTSQLGTAGDQVGTPAYMSPEQVEGEELDARSDIFSFGVVLYEMATGTLPFNGATYGRIAHSILSETPTPATSLNPSVPPKVERVINKALQKDRNRRYQNTADIVEDLKKAKSNKNEGAQVPCEQRLGIAEDDSEFQAEVNRPALSWRRLSKDSRIGIRVLLVLLAIGTLSGWLVHRNSRQRWARNEALPQIEKLIDEDKRNEAFDLALQAERYIPGDPMLSRILDDISWEGSITTTPSGVSVFEKKYGAAENAWEFIGRSPIKNRRFPTSGIAWKFELKGFTPVERASLGPFPVTVTMDAVGNSPPGMVRVELPPPETGGDWPVSLSGLAGYEDLPAIPLHNFWIDKFEVTNRQFKKFVEQGGYQKQQYWKQKFQKDGQTLSWSEAMNLFRDTTGRPGPATWVGGDYPKGEADFPVMGVSWYEAAAYAEFVGEKLPTIYHWVAAASPEDAPDVLPLSNFDGRGPASVGTYRGMTWSGAYDMAGNVKEWALNEAMSGKRFIMGGAWDDPTYMFNDADARSPFERSPKFGFRCAKYTLTGGEAKANDAITVKLRKYGSEEPVSEELFQAYKEMYSYDKTPLNAKVESVQEAEDWKQEKISFDAAYGEERVIAYLFLPKKSSPPYQAVVHFPGAAAAHMRSSAKSLSDFFPDFDFIIKGGRAVLFPIYKGTFERGGGPKPEYWPNTSSFYRDSVIMWSKDLGRSIDYLETRPDIDRNKLAYEGCSWGAAMGALLPAVETRFKALLLISPGFYLQERLPEVDQVNFAPRVKAPALMLNGRLDFIWPPSIAQEPMFRLLGTSQEHKRRVVYDTGHDIPRPEMIKESLNWLDRYLGPVR